MKTARNTRFAAKALSCFAALIFVMYAGPIKDLQRGVSIKPPGKHWLISGLQVDIVDSARHKVRYQPNYIVDVEKKLETRYNFYVDGATLGNQLINYFAALGIPMIGVIENGTGDVLRDSVRTKATGNIVLERLLAGTGCHTRVHQNEVVVLICDGDISLARLEDRPTSSGKTVTRT